MKTTYGRVRIDPVSLKVDASDQTFAASVGKLDHGGKPVTSMPYGVAFSCDGKDSGVGSIDLQGTPFQVAPNAFVKGGYSPQGSAEYTENNQVVSLKGGGDCGWMNPAPGVSNPSNQAKGLLLSLQYDTSKPAQANGNIKPRRIFWDSSLRAPPQPPKK